MKKIFLLSLILSFCFVSGCSSSDNQNKIDVLETCKVINSVIEETSISEDKNYFTITFENGLFYCEDHTSGNVIYTIKIPMDKEFDMFAIIKNICPTITEEDFNTLESENEVAFFRAYRAYWYCYKYVEGNTVKYVIE